VEDRRESATFGGGQFTIRFEGPAQSILHLKLVNIDVPKEVNLTLSAQTLAETGSGSGVDVGILVPFGTRPGLYHFQVIVTWDKETHVANFDLSIVQRIYYTR
jgi:hypothetical protein